MSFRFIRLPQVLTEEEMQQEVDPVASWWRLTASYCSRQHVPLEPSGAVIACCAACFNLLRWPGSAFTLTSSLTIKPALLTAPCLPASRGNHGLLHHTLYDWAMGVQW